MTDAVSAVDMYKCTPRQTKAFAKTIIEAGLVPFIHSSPGMGKSSICRNIANEFKLELIDHRLSTSAPEDLSGLPTFIRDADGNPTGATFVPFDIFPVESRPIPAGKDGWLLFLDEANAASRPVQAAAYKLVLDRGVGQMRLHNSVAMVMAGNLATDRSIVQPLSTAMQSRIIHIEMTLSFDEWLEDVAIPQKYDHRIVAFLNYKKEFLMDFIPDHHDKTFCCPRTWEFKNKILKVDPVITDAKTAMYAGAITSGVAASFVQFCKVFGQIPTIKDVLADPRGLAVPNATDHKWAVTTHLVENTDDKNINDVGDYIGRFPMEYRVLFYRSLIVQKPELRANPGFATALVALSRYLNDDQYTPA